MAIQGRPYPRLVTLNRHGTPFYLTNSDQRQQESNKIRQKYPDRIPVIVQKVEGSQIEKIDKRKYLVSVANIDLFLCFEINKYWLSNIIQVPADITAAQFMWIIRKRINLPSERAIFLFVDKMVPQSRSVYNSDLDDWWIHPR